MAKLRDYITSTNPFGPIDSSEIKDAHIMEQLFYKHNLIYDYMRSRPNFIIGRKGSGKTAFLRSVRLDTRYSVIVELSPEDSFLQIVQSIESVSKGVVFVESVANLWLIVFWNSIFMQLLNTQQNEDDPDIGVVYKYTSGMNLNKSMNTCTVMKKVVDIFAEKGGNSSIGMISTILKEITFNNVSFETAKDAALNYLSNKGIRAIILLDSLEDFQLNNKLMCHALSGLLRCLALFKRPGTPCEIRCSIPSEIYHILEDLSTNPVKDLTSFVVLHWHASELVRLAAKRYYLYLSLYDPNMCSQFSTLDFSKRSDAITFLNMILPVNIKNRLGLDERALAYILRHTQLSPRQFLFHLNNIYAKQVHAGKKIIQFERDSIVDGIFHGEAKICKEIFRAFNYVYPLAEQACEKCIPHLPLHFYDTQLHEAYNRSGLKKSSQLSYADFRRMMIEIGAVGRVTHDDSDRYTIGQFEYTMPHRLIVNQDEALCLHPVFTEVFGAKKKCATQEFRVIYPYGCDLEGPEYREII